jgi:beta-D-xylosidase 4
MKGDAISSEMRAIQNSQKTLGLSGFGPNINLVKDPRYGRNSEVPGEDPFLSGSYAVSYLHGMQQMSSGE